MTRKYIYIPSVSLLDASTPVYFVGVGTSMQANRDYLWLTARAVEHGDYFEIYGESSAAFLERWRKYYGRVAAVQLSARSLVRAFKTGVMPTDGEPSAAAAVIHFQRVLHNNGIPR